MLYRFDSAPITCRGQQWQQRTISPSWITFFPEFVPSFRDVAYTLGILTAPLACSISVLLAPFHVNTLPRSPLSSILSLSLYIGPTHLPPLHTYLLYDFNFFSAVIANDAAFHFTVTLACSFRVPSFFANFIRQPLLLIHKQCIISCACVSGCGSVHANVCMFVYISDTVTLKSGPGRWRNSQVHTSVKPVGAVVAWQCLFTCAVVVSSMTGWIDGQTRKWERNSLTRDSRHSSRGGATATFLPGNVHSGELNRRVCLLRFPMTLRYYVASGTNGASNGGRGTD